MKKNALLIGVLSLLSFPSCKKKKYTCGTNYYYTTVFVVFKGFSGSDLSRVLIRTYEPNGQFDHILSADTFDYSNASFQNDTAYPQNLAGKIGFYELVKGKEYQFDVLSTSQSYKIGNLHDGVLFESQEVDAPCTGYGGSTPTVVLAELMDVNGVPATTFKSTVNTPLVSLNH